jgi:hypothetical protein
MTLLISYVDDFRIGGSEAVIQTVYEAMFKEWGITSCDGTRFLGAYPGTYCRVLPVQQQYSNFLNTYNSRSRMKMGYCIV